MNNQKEEAAKNEKANLEFLTAIIYLVSATLGLTTALINVLAR